MYGGIDKYSGDIACQKKSEDLDNSEVMNQSNCFETIVATNERGEEVLLGPSLDISTGGLKWNYVDNKDATYKNVMGMSQMASMLKDTRRNNVYNAAITECIHDFIEKTGRKPYVLDIGCGTGLLSLQAARAGAEKVYACEMFASWVEIAKENVKENGYEDSIFVTNKHSSLLIVKDDSNQSIYDLERKCDILISEILDTVLLGEGVLIAVRDAKRRLLVKDAIIIPEKADIFINMVHSDSLFNLTTIQDKTINGVNMSCGKRDPCLFTHLLPFHLDIVNQENKGGIDFKSCSEQIVLTTVDLTDSMNKRLLNISIPVTSKPNGLILSWTTHLYKGKFDYSTRIDEILPEQWQDHWLQAFYAIHGLEGNIKTVELVALMNDTNWRFNCCSRKDRINITKSEIIKPLQCTCGFHSLLNSGLFGLYNDAIRNGRLNNMLDKLITIGQNDSIKCVLDIGDDSYLSTALSLKLIRNKSKNRFNFYSLEEKSLSLMLWKQIIEYNRSKNSLIQSGPSNPLLSQVFSNGNVDAVVWNFHQYQMEDNVIMESISYWCMVNSLKPFLSPSVLLFPSLVNIMAMNIELGPLYDSFGSVDEVNGFKHTAFSRAVSDWDNSLYPFPLYMYTYKQLSEPQAVLSIDFRKDLYSVEIPCVISTLCDGILNCTVLWSEYYIGDIDNFKDIPANWITPFIDGEFVHYQKQLLQFKKEKIRIKKGEMISVLSSLDQNLSFHIKVEKQ